MIGENGEGECVMLAAGTSMAAPEAVVDEYDPTVLPAALDGRPGWKRTGDNWYYLPSTPPGNAATERHFGKPCEPSSISVDGFVHPPAVRYYCDEDVDGPVDVRTAAEITGIDHEPLGGEVESIEFDRDEDIVSVLAEIETWRWPSALPARTFGAGVARIQWEHGHPHDLGTIREALAARDGWRVDEETSDGLSLAQLWPTWTYRPSGKQATTIRPDRHSGTGYLIWPPVMTYSHVHVPDAVALIHVLAQIETWRRDCTPRWLDRSAERQRNACPRCNAGVGAACDPRPGYASVIHAERLDPEAFAVGGRGTRAPKPGQRTQGRKSGKRRKGGKR